MDLPVYSQRSIEVIEDLPLEAEDRMYLIMVLLGCKPAMHMAVLSAPWREGEELRSSERQRLIEITSMIESTGLAVVCSGQVMDDELMHLDGLAPETRAGRKRYCLNQEFFVAKELSQAKQAEAAFRSDSDRACGAAMGYPETSINAFETGGEARIEHEELPAEVQETDGYKFCGFVLSRDHWRKELTLVQSWADVCRAVSPQLYFEMTARW